MSSYREQLNQKDHRGTILFSPICGVTPDFGHEFQKQKEIKKEECWIDPVTSPGNLVNHIDDKDSAGAFLQDPTYSQIVRNGWDDTNMSNPALRVYHLEKSLQKGSSALFDTFDLILDSGLHRNDYRPENLNK